MSGVEVIGRWHEFHVLAGTAAVTLVGLLFVALSLHLDVLLHDRHAHLLTYARQTLTSFTFPLMMVKREPYLAHWMVGAVSLLLGNALGSSWDLLVQVGRLKRTLEAGSAAPGPAAR